MNTNKKTDWILVLAILLFPVAYAAWVYPSLPATIATHFSADGKPNGYGGKETIWWITLLFTLIGAGIYLLIRYLPRIDPRQTAGASAGSFKKIALVIVCFLAIINLAIIRSATSKQFLFHQWLLPMLGLFFSILGYYMRDIKPNYFVGFRLPWTLENDENWRKTHQLVSKLWVPGGIFLAVTSFLLPFLPGLYLFIAIISTITIIPIVFSYRLFRNQ